MVNRFLKKFKTFVKAIRYENSYGENIKKGSIEKNLKSYKQKTFNKKNQIFKPKMRIKESFLGKVLKVQSTAKNLPNKI